MNAYQKQAIANVTTVEQYSNSDLKNLGNLYNHNKRLEQDLELLANILGKKTVERILNK